MCKQFIVNSSKLEIKYLVTYKLYICTLEMRLKAGFLAGGEGARFGGSTATGGDIFTSTLTGSWTGFGFGFSGGGI